MCHDDIPIAYFIYVVLVHPRPTSIGVRISYPRYILFRQYHHPLHLPLPLYPNPLYLTLLFYLSLSAENFPLLFPLDSLLLLSLLHPFTPTPMLSNTTPPPPPIIHQRVQISILILTLQKEKDFWEQKGLS